MRVKILKRSFAGAEFAPDVRVLKVGGQSSAGVEKLEFELPAEWQGLSVTLHVQWLDGTLPAPVLLDDEDSVAVDKTLTASPGGQWMLLALGADGYRALTKPTKYECYSTLNTDGDVEISPTQYETFVARVLEYSNTAQQAAASAKTNAETAATAATRAVNAKGQAETAARTATAGAENSENSAARAEAAAARAEAAAPETGKVVSVNGKGGAVILTAQDLGAVPQGSDQVVKSLTLAGKILTVELGDGSKRTFTTQDTTSLKAMTGVLQPEHGRKAGGCRRGGREGRQRRVPEGSPGAGEHPDHGEGERPEAGADPGGAVYPDQGGHHPGAWLYAHKNHSRDGGPDPRQQQAGERHGVPGVQCGQHGQCSQL